MPYMWQRRDSDQAQAAQGFCTVGNTRLHPVLQLIVIREVFYTDFEDKHLEQVEHSTNIT